MGALLVRQNDPAMTDAITYTVEQYIPTTYLKTRGDQGLFPDWRKNESKQ